MHFEATGLIRLFLQSYVIRVSVGYPLGVIFQPEFRKIPKITIRIPDLKMEFRLKDDPEGVPHTLSDGVRLQK